METIFIVSTNLLGTHGLETVLNNTNVGNYLKPRDGDYNVNLIVAKF